MAPRGMMCQFIAPTSSTKAVSTPLPDPSRDSSVRFTYLGSSSARFGDRLISFLALHVLSFLLTCHFGERILSIPRCSFLYPCHHPCLFLLPYHCFYHQKFHLVLSNPTHLHLQPCSKSSILDPLKAGLHLRFSYPAFGKLSYPSAYSFPLSAIFSLDQPSWDLCRNSH